MHRIPEQNVSGTSSRLLHCNMYLTKARPDDVNGMVADPAKKKCLGMQDSGQPKFANVHVVIGFRAIESQQLLSTTISGLLTK